MKHIHFISGSWSQVPGRWSSVYLALILPFADWSGSWSLFFISQVYRDFNNFWVDVFQGSQIKCDECSSRHYQRLISGGVTIWRVSFFIPSVCFTSGIDHKSSSSCCRFYWRLIGIDQCYVNYLFISKYHGCKWRFSKQHKPDGSFHLKFSSVSSSCCSKHLETWILWVVNFIWKSWFDGSLSALQIQ